jgi:hypothetical protein
VEGGQDARLTIRLSSQQAKRIRDIHAQTFPTHRMSLNRWMAATLLAAKT